MNYTKGEEPQIYICQVIDLQDSEQEGGDLQSKKERENDSIPQLIAEGNKNNKRRKINAEESKKKKNEDDGEEKKNPKQKKEKQSEDPGNRRQKGIIFHLLLIDGIFIKIQ